MQNTAISLHQEFRLAVIGPKGCRDHLPTGVDVFEASTSTAGFLVNASVLATRIVLRSKPKLVIGGSALASPLVLWLQTVFRIPGIVFVHGLDIIVSNVVYQTLFVPCLRRIKQIVANSEHTASLARRANVPATRIGVIHPGTNLPDVDRSAARRDFVDLHGISHEHILLFVGRVIPRKGLLGFVENVFPKVVETLPSTCLVVVGDHPADAIERHENELGKVLDAARARGLDDHILVLGHVADTELIDAYAAADMLILPVVHTPGDVEGFGMVAVEAAACGTPAAAFAVGGVVDAISDGYSGYLIAPDDYEGFVATIVRQLTEHPVQPSSCLSHAEKFSWRVFGARITRSVRDLYDRFG